MNKRRLFAIVLFIAVGLFMFTFANPNDRVGQGSEGNGSETTTPASDTELTDNGNTNQPVVNPVDNNQNNNQNNNQPAPTPVVIDLTADKEAAKEEIRKYAENVVLDDAKKQEIVNDAFTNIDNAATKEEIDQIVIDTKKALDDAAKAELDAYKDAAKEEINEYAKDIDLDQTKKEEIINDAFTNIDNAATKEEVDQIVIDTKKALDDAAKAELDAYKDAAKDEITEYAKNVVLDETKKQGIIDDAFTNIDNAATKEEIDQIVIDTKKALDDAAKAELDAYKDNAIEELNNYKKDEKYTEENQEVVNSIKEDGVEDITNAATKEEVDEKLAGAKEEIDNVPVLTYIVTFKDFKGNETKVEVVHDTLVTAPVISDVVVDRDITYGFAGWDKDLTKVVTNNMVVTAKYDVIKVEANIYMLHDGIAIPANGATAGKANYDYVGKIELNLNNKDTKKEILNRIKKNYTKNVTLDEEVIKTYVVGNLPYSDNTEYVYTYYVLKFEKGDGFHIDFARSKNNAPVITLTGDLYKEVYQQKGHFDFTKGFSVSDDHTALTNADVQIKIIKNNNSEVKSVNYEKPGKYVISYTATDAEGNTTTVSRTVKVLENKVESIELSSNNDTYEYNADLNLKVYGTYSDGSVKEVAYEIDGFDSTLVGSNTASVKVEGFDAIDYNYTVVNKVTSLVLSSNDDSYNYGSALNLTVNAVYQDGTVEEAVAYEIDAFLNTNIGANTATITYKEGTETYRYTIVNQIVSVALASNNDTYIKGETSRLAVKATYANGEVGKITYTVDPKTPFDTTTTGSKTMNINAAGTPLVYKYTVNYSNEQLKELFKNTSAELYFFGLKMEFNNLPKDAKVVEVYKTGNKPVSLSKNKGDNYNVYRLGFWDYESLRHNFGKDINITYEINGQKYKHTYDESWGEIR